MVLLAQAFAYNRETRAYRPIESSAQNPKMYGVPRNLDLTAFHGATCIQIAIGEFQIQFHFHPLGSISVDGRWEFRCADGTIVDEAMENGNRETFRVHKILGKSVRESFVNSPTSFGLRFENGCDLEIFDDAYQFESCQIAPNDIVI